MMNQEKKIKATRELLGPAVQSALAQLRAVRFTNGAMSYWVLRLSKRYDAIVREATAEYQELMKKFSVTPEMLQAANGTPPKEGADPIPELPADFIEADKAFHKAEIDFGLIHKLDVAQLSEARLSANMLDALEPLVDFSNFEPVADDQLPSNVQPIKQGGA